VEGADGLMMHELLLGGHLYLQLLKDKMQVWLHVLKSVILKKAKPAAGFTLTNSKFKEVTQFHYHCILNTYFTVY
jgi:DNA-directed RNA polymerase I subunit RPA2